MCLRKRGLHDGPRQLFQIYGFVAREAPEEDEESAAPKLQAAGRLLRQPQPLQPGATGAAKAAEAAAIASCGKLEHTELPW
jgi:hypothetical protein